MKKIFLPLLTLATIGLQAQNQAEIIFNSPINISCNFGTHGLFRANHPDYGVELFSTDGTASGTYFFKDLEIGEADSYPSLGVLQPDGIFYFRTDTDKLFRTDGTILGTYTIVDDTQIKQLGIFRGELNGFMYFNAGIHNHKKLYTFNGNPNSHNLVDHMENIQSVELIKIFNNTHFLFSAFDGFRTKLYISDGANHEILHTSLGNNHNNEIYLFDSLLHNGKVYFGFADDEHGHEPWVTDGTIQGTHVLKDIYDGGSFSNSHPGQYTAIGDKVLFSARDIDNGMALWATDGTDAGTMMIFDGHPGTYLEGRPNFLGVYNDELIFYIHDGQNINLYKSNGTTEGTILIHAFSTSINLGVRPLIHENKLYFSKYDPVIGVEPYFFNLDTYEIELILDVVPGSVSSNPMNFYVINNRLIFQGYDPNQNKEVTYGLDLGKLGTAETQSTDLKIYPNPVENYVNFSQKVDRVMVYDMMGQLVKTYVNADRINLVHLQPSVYLIKCEIGNKTITKKIVKN